MPKFVHDLRIGAGYGFTGRKGFQNPDVSGNLFPYNVDTSEINDEESEDEESLNLSAEINNKISYGNLAKQPNYFSRVDRFTLAKNRLNLAESESNARTLIGLVPYPMRSFDGPALGGDSVNPSYRTRPGRIDGSPYGWTKGVLSPMLPAEDSPPRFMDAINPDVRERANKKLKISRLKQF